MRVYDPLVKRFPAKIESNLNPMLRWCDVAVAMVDHKEIKDIEWASILPKGKDRPLILDTRGFYIAQKDPRIRGFGY